MFPLCKGDTRWPQQGPEAKMGTWELKIGQNRPGTLERKKGDFCLVHLYTFIGIFDGPAWVLLMLCRADVFNRSSNLAIDENFSDDLLDKVHLCYLLPFALSSYLQIPDIHFFYFSSNFLLWVSVLSTLTCVFCVTVCRYSYYDIYIFVSILLSSTVVFRFESNLTSGVP